jgi:hypothetical protein
MTHCPVDTTDEMAVNRLGRLQGAWRALVAGELVGWSEGLAHTPRLFCPFWNQTVTT